MKDINKLLKKENITRKDLIDEGFTDYEIKKFVDSGIIVKCDRALYKVLETDDLIITKLVDAFTKHDSLEVASLYDKLKDKDSYNYDIIKLLLVSLSRIENVLTQGYVVNKDESVLNSSTFVENIEEVNDEDFSLVSSEITENNYENLDVNIKSNEDDYWLSSIDNFETLDDYLDYLYEVYKNFNRNDFFLAKEALLKYINLCEENNITGDYYYKLALLENKISRIDVPKDIIYKHYQISIKIKKNIKEYDASNNLLIERLFDDYRNLGFYENDFEYHYMLGNFYRLEKKYLKAKDEYLKAIDICKFSPNVYYCLAITTFALTRPFEKCNEALSYMQKFVFYEKSRYLSSKKNSFLAILSLFSDKISDVYKIFSDVESRYNEEYISNFYNIFGINLNKRYNKLSNEKDDFVKNREMLLFLEENFGEFLDYNSDVRNFNFENPLQCDIDVIKSIVESNDCDKLSKLDDAVLSIGDDEVRNKLMLESAVILAENNYISKAKRYLKVVEQIPSKTEELKESFMDARSRVKIRSCKK